MNNIFQLRLLEEATKRQREKDENILFCAPNDPVINWMEIFLRKSPEKDEEEIFIRI